MGTPSASGRRPAEAVITNSASLKPKTAMLAVQTAPRGTGARPQPAEALKAASVARTTKLSTAPAPLVAA